MERTRLWHQVQIPPGSETWVPPGMGKGEGLATHDQGSGIDADFVWRSAQEGQIFFPCDFRTDDRYEALDSATASK
jgi:hypothetical protein